MCQSCIRTEAEQSLGVITRGSGEAMDLQLLQDRGITGVVNLVGWWQLASAIGVESSDDPVEMLTSFYEGNKIAFCAREALDNMTYELVDNDWPAVKETLQQWKQERRKVLVNCKAGHNRSACMVVCWLIACEGMDLLSAASHVSTLRGNILSNHSFRLQLVRLILQEGWPIGPENCDAKTADAVSETKVDDACMGA